MLPTEVLLLVFSFLNGGGKLISADQVNFALTNRLTYGLTTPQPAYKQFLELLNFVKKNNIQFHDFTLNFKFHTLGDAYHFSALACVCAGKWIGSTRNRLSYDSSNLTSKSSGLTSDQIFNFLEGSARYGTPARWSVSRTEVETTYTRHVAGRATQMIAQLFNANFVLTCRTITDGFLAAAGTIEPDEEEFFLGVQALFTSQPFCGSKVLVWGRNVGSPAPGGVDTRYRNSDADLIEILCDIVISLGMVPVLMGDSHEGTSTRGCIDLRGFHARAPFKGHPLSVPKQLRFIHRLRFLDENSVCAQLGVKTGGLDGPALMCLPSVVVDLETNEKFKQRMRLWHDCKMPYRVVDFDAPGAPGARKYDRFQIKACKEELQFLIGDLIPKPKLDLPAPETPEKDRPPLPTATLGLLKTLAADYYGCKLEHIMAFMQSNGLDLSGCSDADEAFDVLLKANFDPNE